MLDAHIDLGVGDFHLDARIAAERGEVVAILGPNGSGKSTVLRALAGLWAVERGWVRLDGEVLDDPATNRFAPPSARPISVVFQDYLLFPHLNASDNVAFGLRATGETKGAARRRAREWLDRFGVGDKATAKPAQLSGGQAQRVALARALARAPRLLLLDEPLAALDAGTRMAVRRDLRHYLDDFDGATIIVTHDPLDAIALGSRVVVLERGRVAQAGSLAELTERPRTRYVADLVGLNLLHGFARGTTVELSDADAAVTVADPAEGPVHLLIHPNAVALHSGRRPDGSPRNQWPARIDGFDLLGDRVRVRLAGRFALVAEVTPATVDALGLHAGQDVWAAVKATEITTYPA